MLGLKLILTYLSDYSMDDKYSEFIVYLAYLGY